MLSDPASKLAAFARLSRQLDARRRSGTARGDEQAVATGLAGVDEALGGGLPRGALTELVFAAPSSGGQLVLLHLLQAARRLHRFLGFVDGADGFDPQTIEPAGLLHHLLWVRCAGAAAALQATDLIARDSNFALLALDLRGCAARELRRTPSTVWYRLQRVLEPTSTALVVLTPQRLVPAARARLMFTRPLPLTCLTMEQDAIGEQLAPAVERVRAGAGWETTTAAATSPTIAYSQGHGDEALESDTRIVAEETDGYAAIAAVG
ncbi:MAG: hypothetical protein IAE82_05050 [Opitutaceae bacterium]|nr:hypothetical protein [Opitutaceae bacterium]